MSPTTQSFWVSDTVLHKPHHHFSSLLIHKLDPNLPLLTITQKHLVFDRSRNITLNSSSPTGGTLLGHTNTYTEI